MPATPQQSIATPANFSYQDRDRATYDRSIPSTSMIPQINDKLYDQFQPLNESLFFDYKSFDAEKYLKNKRKQLLHEPHGLIQLHQEALVESMIIEINGNDELVNLNLTGVGSSEDPYILENLNITKSIDDPAIYIRNTNLSLVLANNLIVHRSNVNTTNFGIRIDNSENVRILNNTIQNEEGKLTGILIRDSVNVLLENNVMTELSISISGQSDGIVLRNNSIVCDLTCLEITDSENIILENEQYSSAVDNGIDILRSNNILIQDTRVTEINQISIDIFESNDINIFNTELTWYIKGGVRMILVNYFMVVNSTLHQLESSVPIQGVVDNFGLEVLLSNHGIVNDNQISNLEKTVSQRSGTMKFGGGNIIIGGSRSVDDAGTNITICKNQVVTTGMNGIYILGLSNSRIAENDVVNSRKDGLFVTGSNNLKIEENTLKFNIRSGLRIAPNSDSLSGSWNINITSNMISNNKQVGIWLEDSRSIILSQNEINENEIGIYGYISNDTIIHENTISENQIGIELSSISNFTIQSNLIKNQIISGVRTENIISTNIIQNEIKANERIGIEVIQQIPLQELHITQNNITDHSLAGSTAININIDNKIKENPLFIYQNRLDYNFEGIQISGNGVVVMQNSFEGIKNQEKIMFFAITLNLGSNNNIIGLNNISDSFISHIIISSTLSIENSDETSKDNIIMWNNFYSVDLVPAFDHFAHNLFAYNYWGNLTSNTTPDDHGFSSQSFLLSTTPEIETSQADYFPLLAPAHKSQIGEINFEFLPDPILTSFESGVEITRNATSTNSIHIDWLQLPAPQLFEVSNRSSFQYSVDYRAKGATSGFNLVASGIESELLWNISNENQIPDGIYEIVIDTTDLIFDTETEYVFEINIGPISESNDQGEIVIPLVIGSVLITGIAVYGFTTYRYNSRFRASTDTHESARRYLDFVRKMRKEDEDE